MTARASVLHITAHLGGGVGRALSTLATTHHAQGAPFEHVFACLESPHDTMFVDRLRAAGFTVHAPVDEDGLGDLAAAADIVQLEWWHHPRVIGWLARRGGLRSRLVMWAHTSGLHVPALPERLVTLPHAFLYTTFASPWDGGAVGANLVDVVSSSGGFDDIPRIQRRAPTGRLHYGYLGSFNPTKLHLDFVAYLGAVDDPDFSVEGYGDASIAPAIRRAVASGAAPLRLHGHTNRPFAALRELDVLIYLLNPHHYGTTENALLEAMACGVVPVVMDNPVERSIVKHGETGWVIGSPDALNATIERMNRRPNEWQRMSEAASRHVRETYSADRTSGAMAQCYDRILGSEKMSHDVMDVLGKTPADWFVAGLGRYADLLEVGSGVPAREKRRLHAFLYEHTKGSAFHFHRCFPSDLRLRRWVRMLESDLASVAA